MKNLGFFLGLILVLFFYSCGGGDGDDNLPITESLVTTEDLLDLYTGEKRGTSELTRVDGAISFKIETTNLIPGHVYQVLCGVFNKPKNCVGNCDPEDFIKNNAAVEGVAFVMAGKRVNSTSATFEGTLNLNDINSYDWFSHDGPENGWGGLNYPLSATIALSIRSQGPVQDGQISAQINTYANACSYNAWGILDPSSRVPEEIGECAYIQTSYHVAP